MLNLDACHAAKWHTRRDVSHQRKIEPPRHLTKCINDLSGKAAVELGAIKTTSNQLCNDRLGRFWVFDDSRVRPGGRIPIEEGTAEEQSWSGDFAGVHLLPEAAQVANYAPDIAHASDTMGQEKYGEEFPLAERETRWVMNMHVDQSRKHVMARKIGLCTREVLHIISYCRDETITNLDCLPRRS
jgi:hypothetical protein